MTPMEAMSRRMMSTRMILLVITLLLMPSKIVRVVFMLSFTSCTWCTITLLVVGRVSCACACVVCVCVSLWCVRCETYLAVGSFEFLPVLPELALNLVPDLLALQRRAVGLCVCVRVRGRATPKIDALMRR